MSKFWWPYQRFLIRPSSSSTQGAKLDIVECCVLDRRTEVDRLKVGYFQSRTGVRTDVDRLKVGYLSLTQVFATEISHSIVVYGLVS